MSTKHLAHILIALVCTMSTIAQASEDRFICRARAFFGKTPCGKEKYAVPDKGVLRVKLDRVEHNFCIKVDAIDVATNKNVASGILVCRGSDTIVWPNHTGTTFNLKLAIHAADLDQSLGGDGLTGAVVIE